MSEKFCTCPKCQDCRKYALHILETHYRDMHVTNQAKILAFHYAELFRLISITYGEKAAEAFESDFKNSVKQQLAFINDAVETEGIEIPGIFLNPDYDFRTKLHVNSADNISSQDAALSRSMRSVPTEGASIRSILTAKNKPVPNDKRRHGRFRPRVVR